MSDQLPMKHFRFATACLFSLMIVGSSPATADDTGRSNARMKRLIGPISQAINGSVVQVLSGDRPVALGTVVAADGYVLTKRSELSGDPIKVRLSDNRVYPARVAQVRRQNDLALLHVASGGELQPVEFAQIVPPIASFLLTPDRQGRPIGIGVVGTRPRPIRDEGKLGVRLGADYKGRAEVEGVESKSGADLAGIRTGDVIVGVDGRNEPSKTGVLDALQQLFPGERVRLTILRRNDDQGVETLEMDARITEWALMMESDSDVRVNGPRNARLSGFDNVIQHDTVLDPEECGGPVLDTSGRVVGINIARAGRVVSYAIPSSLIAAELQTMLAAARRGK
jgi:S1-C subfamily serine protease